MRLRNVLNTSRRHVNKNSFNFIIRLEEIFARRLEDVFKMSGRRLEDFLKIFLQDFLKKPWRRIAKTNILVLTKTSTEEVRLRRTYSSSSKRLEDVLKASSENEDERRLQDVFIKTNVCWDIISKKPGFLSEKLKTLTSSNYHRV